MQFLYFLEGGRDWRNARKVLDNDAATWHNFMKMHTLRSADAMRAMHVKCAIGKLYHTMEQTECEVEQKW